MIKLAAKALASNFFTSRYKLTFAVTYKCNSKCKTCNIWKKKSRNELKTKEIKEFFSKNKFPWVNLTGGEVFLRDDIPEIVKAAKPELLNITTNGFSTGKILQTVSKIRKLAEKVIVPVSIDGPEKTHNKIKGVKSWKNAVATYAALRKMDSNYNNFQTYVGMTISKFNAKKIEETFTALKKHIPNLTKKDIHFNLYQTSDLYFSNKKDKSANKRRLKNLIKKQIDNKKGFDAVSILERKYLKRSLTYLDKGKTPLPCKAMKSSLFIDPQGNVYPCTMFNKKLGSLRDHKFQLNKILKTDKAKKIQEQIAAKKCPQCWTPCEAYQTILGNLFKR